MPAFETFKFVRSEPSPEKTPEFSVRPDELTVAILLPEPVPPAYILIAELLVESAIKVRLGKFPVARRMPPPPLYASGEVLFTEIALTCKISFPLSTTDSICAPEPAAESGLLS